MLDKKKARVQRSRAVHLPAVEINPPRVDWRQVLKDLHNAGCSGYRVSISLGAAWSTVQHWQESPTADPGYGYARALLRLHSVYCGAGLTTLRLSQAEQ